MKTCPTCNGTYPSRFSVCPQDGAKLAETSGWDDGAIVRGKYRILAKLGQGGMGAVYKASHMVFDEVRALKVINPELITDETFLKRFKQEAVIARKLDHPNAVRVDDLDESEDGLPFIVMEYIEGRSLKDLIEKEGPVEPHRAARIASQVAAALDAAHRLGMVHRDIKPANIVLIQSPAGEQAKVLDFGIAKIKEARSADSSGMTLTGTGIVVGTPQYMSPEQALGKRGSELDGRSDLYSLGVVLYQMLAGQLPFKADTTMQILLAHINTPPRPILEVRPDSRIPPALAAVVMKCLAKDPHDRPASGAALIDALRAVETGALPEAADLEDVASATQVLRPQQSAPRVERESPSAAVAPEPRAATPMPDTRPPAPPEPIAAAGMGGEMGRKSHTGRTGLIAGIIAALVVIGIVAAVLVMHPFKPRPSQTPALASAPVPPSGNAAPSSSSSAPVAAPPGEPAASQPGAVTATSTAATNAPGAAPSEKVEKITQVSEAGKMRGAAQNRVTAAESRKLEKAPASKPAQAPAQSLPETLLAKATPPPAAAPAGNPSLSTVIVDTAPGAHILLDGKSAGVANASGKLTVANLSPGTHDLRASLAGFNDIDYTIQLPPGGTSFIHAKWGAAQSQVERAAPAPNAAAARSVSASFPVAYLHAFGSSRGLLVIGGGNVHYQPSNGAGAFVSPISGISWGSNGRREFYIRLKDGGTHRFRSPSAGEILATLDRAAQAQGRPTLGQ